MIICLTVHDNDFTNQIKHYMDNFTLYIRELMPEFDSDSLTYEEIKNRHYRETEISRLMNPNMNIVLTDADKKLILQQIKYTFGVFADYHFDKETAKYLKNHLSIKILLRVEDKWENGEVYYWFQHADSYIVI